MYVSMHSMYNVLVWISYFPTEIDISEQNYKTLIFEMKQIYVDK